MRFSTPCSSQAGWAASRMPARLKPLTMVCTSTCLTNRETHKKKGRKTQLHNVELRRSKNQNTKEAAFSLRLQVAIHDVDLHVSSVNARLFRKEGTQTKSQKRKRTDQRAAKRSVARRQRRMLVMGTFNPVSSLN